MEKPKNLLYITFDIGEEAGSLPSYFKEAYTNFHLLSIYLHDLPHQGKNKLAQYRNGQKFSEETFFTPTRNILLIYSNIFRLIFIALTRTPAPITVVSMNPYFLVFAHILSFMGIRQEFFVVGDSPHTAAPKSVKNKILRLFYNKALRISDKVWFITRKLYQTSPRVFHSDKAYLHPFGLKQKLSEPSQEAIGQEKYHLVYVGNLSDEKAGLLFNFLQEISGQPIQLKTLIIGAGELTEKFRHLAEQYPQITFAGPVYDGKKLASYFKQSAIGLALFDSRAKDYSYYGDPVKIKLYLSHGLPVVTDSSPEIARDIDKYQAGAVVKNPSDGEALLQAVREITGKYQEYQKNVKALAQEYNYQKICRQFFNI